MIKGSEKTRRYLAFDLGAESGRMMAGIFDGESLSLEEWHRFPNVPIRQGESLHWDLEALFTQIGEGLRMAGQHDQPFDSLSCDSWGVDYVLLDSQLRLIPPAYHYRDPRTTQGYAKVLSRLSRQEIFEQTGIQFMLINGLYQLATESPERLAQASQLLGVADWVHLQLSGVAQIDESMASTYQLYNPRTRDWCWPMIDRLNFPRHLFPPVIPCGQRVGTLTPAWQKQTGLGPLAVIASCSHDTGTAVSAVPAQGKEWAFLSSGTWSLIGLEMPSPLINEAALEANFTNEIGWGGSIRFLKNIVGLWIIQECRREWSDAGQSLNYDQLTREAAQAPAFVSFIYPNDPRFVSPGNMVKKIQDFCRETHQPIPTTPGTIVRCVLESLALMYRTLLIQVAQLAGRTVRVLHIVGGGSKNELLNQWTANALEIPVLAGPVEATALGNVILQGMALGHLPSLEAGRKLIADSFPLKRFEPMETTAWRAARARFERLLPS